MQLRELKSGDTFQLANSKNKVIYVRAHYCRDIKRFCVTKWLDINFDRFFPASLEVIAADFGDLYEWTYFATLSPLSLFAPCARLFYSLESRYDELF